METIMFRQAIENNADIGRYVMTRPSEAGRGVDAVMFALL
jgi:hypothetical protein